MCVSAVSRSVVPGSLQEYWSGPPSLLQGLFRMQGLNPSLLHWQVCPLALSQLGRQKICPNGIDQFELKVT